MNDESKWDLIFSYTRAQAITDGVLVDVTETAKEAGFRVPVALTHAAWAECVAVPEDAEGQDEAGRLWDVLWMCRLYSRQLMAGPVIQFRLSVMKEKDRLEVVTLKAVCGPADDGSPCVTIMLPDED